MKDQTAGSSRPVGFWLFAPPGVGVNEEPERSGARRSQNQSGYNEIKKSCKEILLNLFAALSEN